MQTADHMFDIEMVHYPVANPIILLPDLKKSSSEILQRFLIRFELPQLCTPFKTRCSFFQSSRSSSIGKNPISEFQVILSFSAKVLSDKHVCKMRRIKLLINNSVLLNNKNKVLLFTIIKYCDNPCSENKF